MKRFIPNLIGITEDINEVASEPLSSCNKCKNQYQIKSATIQKWLMDVPTEVSKPKKNKAPSIPVKFKLKVDEMNDINIQPEKSDLKSNTDEEVEKHKEKYENEENKENELKKDKEQEEKDERKHNEENEEKQGRSVDDEDDYIDDDEEESINIECDSLERSMNYKKKCGYHTPSDYGYIRPDLSPVLSNSALPLEEELTVRTTYTYDTITKRENYYEHISGPDCVREKPKKEILPDILNRSSERYSLVSEVYVNDSFNTSMSPNNTIDKKIKKKSPGQITIEVEDCPDNHPIEDSDSFEPDTLDRNCTKIKPKLKTVYSSDSLEQSNSPKSMNNGFGSLLEIYEAKNVMADVQRRWNVNQVDAKYLKPDPKHCRRQRCPSPSSIPKPPKNVCVRSTSKNRALQFDCIRSQHNRQTHEIVAGASDKQAVKSLPTDHNRYEDSGYLSTESNESLGKVIATTSMDTDESGAESIDTDFKFFKTRTDRNYCDW